MVIEPLVSICIPTYNGEAYLSEALDSALAQTYTNLEIVVSDDASTDGTLDIVGKYKDKTPIPIRVFHHAPNGIGANWNYCMQQAQGRYIKFLFQDDVLEPTCVEAMLTVFKNHPEVGLVACKRAFIVEKVIVDDAQKQWLDDYKNLQVQFNSFKELLYLDKTMFKRRDFLQSPLNKIGEPSVVMFKRGLIDTIGWFRTDLKQVLDYEYWYRIVKHHPAVVINKPLAKFRVHAEQETQKNKARVINDYSVYRNILKNDYAQLLHPEVLKRLTPKKHYKGYYFVKNLKKRIKRIFS
ncbi:glycosyltransferase [Flavobacteriaceae bacterium GSB9]|nr:glycosyltransferase [Flavobacteriaceae bacterium GSB9]